MTITRKNPVRRAFSECSTGNDQGRYYDIKGQAVRAFNCVLGGYYLCLDPDDLADFIGDDGLKLVDVHNESGETVGYARFTWHRMESGRYEFIGYIA